MYPTVTQYVNDCRVSGLVNGYKFQSGNFLPAPKKFSPGVKILIKFFSFNHRACNSSLLPPIAVLFHRIPRRFEHWVNDWCFHFRPKSHFPHEPGRGGSLGQWDVLLNKRTQRNIVRERVNPGPNVCICLGHGPRRRRNFLIFKRVDIFPWPTSPLTLVRMRNPPPPAPGIINYLIPFQYFTNLCVESGNLLVRSLRLIILTSN